MTSRGWRGPAIAVAVACCMLGLTMPVCVAADKKQPDTEDAARRAVVRQARAAYYNLRSEGFVQFQANIVPNWAPVMDPLRKTSDPEAIDRALKLLAGLHFAMSLDSSNKVSVTHSADLAAPNPEAAKGFDDIFSGMEQAIKGFFDTWSPFMLTSMFPDVEGDYQVEDLGDRYRVTYKDGDADVVLIMGKNFAISEATVTSPQFQSSIWPEFTSTARGFVLSGYKADYQSTSGKETTKLNVKIVNREESALQLPGTLNVDAIYNGNPYVMEIAFADYRVEKK